MSFSLRLLRLRGRGHLRMLSHCRRLRLRRRHGLSARRLRRVCKRRAEAPRCAEGRSADARGARLGPPCLGRLHDGEIEFIYLVENVFDKDNYYGLIINMI